MIGYIRLFLDLIDIRPTKGGAVVDSPLSGETTAAVLRYLLSVTSVMLSHDTTVTGKDYGRMFDVCTAADGPKTESHAGNRDNINKPKY